jgi:hypothetical protein
MPLALTNVCFEGKNGHDADLTRCLLLTHSGHCAVLYRQRYMILLFVFFTRPLPQAALNSSAVILPSPSTSTILKLTMSGMAWE